ncbi:MAG: tetratricopeptide repeat protein [Spirochaetaceae bacterium]
MRRRFLPPTTVTVPAAFAAVVLLVPAGSLPAQVGSLLEEADELYEDERYEDAIETVERAEVRASSNKERAEVYWQLARAHLGLGDEVREEDGDDRAAMRLYDRGKDYGDRAIEADSGNNLGYYWKASNLGRYGETRGILSSLSQARPMRELLEQSISRDPEHASSYHVLGMLYARVPGGFVSFGNTDYAVSLARKAVELHLEEVERGDEEMYHPIRIELASHLIDRGWSAGRRSREQRSKRREYRGAEDAVERGLYFEGDADIPDMSDEEEAGRILNEVIDELESQAPPAGSRKARHLEQAKELL